MHFRDYDRNRDRDACHRIWHETGWLDKGSEEAMDDFIECGRVLVADLAGEPECLVATCPGTIRYLEEDLPLSCVTGVTTSHIARKQGFGGRLTAAAVAADVAEGMIVSALGMFEQGYYDRLGFGSLGYDHSVSFDPGRLTVETEPRVPRRLTADDWELVHASRVNRFRPHGACNLAPAEMTRAEMKWRKKNFGLGYYDGPNGELTHHFFCNPEGKSHGPYRLDWLVYQTRDQFLELMALLKSLGDQVHLVEMLEPPGIQLQDLIDRPIHLRNVTDGSKYKSTIAAGAWFQVRLCDLAACLQQTHLPGDDVRFNLSLSDPLETKLDDDAPWRGCAGEYVVTLGEESNAEPGVDVSLPTLTASVGAFTRLWLGVRPATGLAITDDLAGPPELIAQLDATLCLPVPKIDWDF